MGLLHLRAMSLGMPHSSPSVVVKRCSRCAQEKPAGDFCKCSANKTDGLQAWCKACSAAYAGEWLEGNVQRRTRHLATANQSAKRRYAEDLEYRECRRKQAAQWREKYPERVSLANRNQRLRREYGIDQAEYERRYAEQHGCCKLCGRHRAKLAVDHDHKTGAIRGLLCGKCNTGLGLLGDDAASMLRAVRYLQGGEVYLPLPFVA